MQPIRIKMSFRRFLLVLLRIALVRKRRQFERELSHPEIYQTRLLKKLLKKSASSSYGKLKKINQNWNFREFSSELPVIQYEDIEPYLDQLSPDPILFYEKTSGSSGRTKKIPYPKTLQESFHTMFLLWLHDLICLPSLQLRTLKIFMSVSPPPLSQNPETFHNVKIGSEDDTNYLNPIWAKLISRFLIIPPDIKRLKIGENFIFALSVILASEAELEVISIWNPSLFFLVLETLTKHSAEIITVMKQREVIRERIRFSLIPLSESRVRALMSQDWKAFWPELKLISCWGEAHARAGCVRLQTEFPHAFVQAKGLLATEAPLTLPWKKANGFIPLPSEVFYEFIPIERDTQAPPEICRLHELKLHEEYDLVISQKGGLLRYAMGDRIRVNGFYLGTPILSFIGRSDAVVDLVGEKLNENFVSECLDQILGTHGFRAVLPMLKDFDGKSRYYLVMDQGSVQVAESIDHLFCEAYHYGIARKLGQLGELKGLVVPHAEKKILAYWQSEGMKMGNIKPSTLVRSVKHAQEILSILKAKVN